MPENQEPKKQKRAYTRHPKPIPTIPAPPPVPMAPTTQARLDERLSQCVMERGKIQEGISSAQGTLALWNDRLRQNQQEIQDIVSLLRQITGQNPMPGLPPQPLLTTTYGAPPSPSYTAFGEIPPGVSSIPSPRQPAQNPNGNAADLILAEGGFK